MCLCFEATYMCANHPQSVLHLSAMWLNVFLQPNKKKITDVI